MIVDFYEAFGNDAAETLTIPQEVLAELNKELPDNLTYFQTSKDHTLLYLNQNASVHPYA